jgi:MerR family transcriptional regulator, thiopeptide resistance regulator
VKIGNDSVSVGEIARLSGVTVRTLHHYDRIGLLRPSARSVAGYRGYDQDDLARLQRILAYRELGFSLEDVRRLLDDPDGDPVARLREQQGLVRERMERLAQVAAVLERTLAAHGLGIRLTVEEMLDVFADHDPAQYADEVRERWGETEAYAESTRRSATYTTEDWRRISADQEAVERRLAAAMAAGLPAGSTEAMDAAEAHRRHVDRAFYPVDAQMHVALAQMYVADVRFTQHYEDVAEGLARYVHEAIVANAARRTENGRIPD